MALLFLWHGTGEGPGQLRELATLLIHHVTGNSSLLLRSPQASCWGLSLAGHRNQKKLLILWRQGRPENKHCPWLQESGIIAFLLSFSLLIRKRKECHFKKSTCIIFISIFYLQGEILSTIRDF